MGANRNQVESIRAIISRLNTPAVFALDTDLTYIAFNDAHASTMQNMLGRSPALGRDIRAVLRDKNLTSEASTHLVTQLNVACETAINGGIGTLNFGETITQVFFRISALIIDRQVLCFLGFHTEQEIQTVEPTLTQVLLSMSQEIEGLTKRLNICFKAMDQQLPADAPVRSQIPKIQLHAEFTRLLVQTIQTQVAELEHQNILLSDFLTTLWSNLSHGSLANGCEINLAGHPPGNDIVRANPHKLKETIKTLIDYAHQAGARTISICVEPPCSATDQHKYLNLVIEHDARSTSEQALPALVKVAYATDFGQKLVIALSKSIPLTPHIAPRVIEAYTPLTNIPPSHEETVDLRPQRSNNSDRQLLILVVDDAPEVRKFMLRILRGHQVVEAEDGIDALQKFETLQRWPDIVVLDLMMPRMDGVQTYHALRQKSATLPILIVSGYHPKQVGVF